MSIHVCYKAKMSELADALIEKLTAEWRDPFDAPVIVFPNNKTEQWFKQYCLTKSTAVANLDCRRMDAFIMDYLREGYRKIKGNENKIIQELKPEILAHAIIAFLKKDNHANLNRTEFEPIQKYCLSAEGKLDERKLYDFAIRLSSLYLEYELSRPQKGFLYETGDRFGFLDAWENENPSFFSEKDRGKEKWQHALYAEVLQPDASGRSFMDAVFDESEKNLRQTEGETVFLTLPYLYREVAKNKDACSTISGTKVFIFGVGGMGQYYYVVLRKFAENNEVYAYIPNPCMQFWDDMQSLKKTEVLFDSAEDAEKSDLQSLEQANQYENVLLQKWGFYGRDTVRMWNLIDEDQAGFEWDNREKGRDELKRLPLLQKIQYLISQRQNVLPSEAQELIENDASLVVRSAPARLREIEALHSSVCELVKKGAKLHEILVVSPTIADYATEISQVFDIPTAMDNVHVPYRIVDPNPKRSFVAGALKTLFGIAAKSDFSRADFFDLIGNPVVQAVRGVTPSDARAFSAWTSAMGVYRNGSGATAMRRDWAKAVRRLLLARLSNDAIEDASPQTMGCTATGEAETQTYSITPYEDMASTDDETLFKFVSLVDDLSAWIAFTAKPYSKKDFESVGGDFGDLKTHLRKWAWMSEPLVNLQGENYVFSRALQSLEQLKFEFFGGLDELPISVLERVVLTGVEMTTYSRGEVFVGGLTFMNFNPSCILPAKHVFFLGADSKSFPGERKEDSLDLRTHQFWLGDTTPVARNKYGFLSLLMNVEESLTISYVNKNLQKDEDFYVTSVVNDLKDFVAHAMGDKEDLLKEGKIPLDEKRPLHELYTSRAIRNHKVFRGLNNERSKTHPKDASLDTKWTHEGDLPKRVTLSDFTCFLEEPCKFQIECRLCRSEENETNVELEPIVFDPLTRSNVMRRTVQAIASGEISDDDASLSAFLHKNFTIPDGLYGKKAVEAVKLTLDGFKDSLGGSFENLIVDENCSLDFGDWKLEGPFAWRLKSSAEGVLTFATLSSKDSSDKFLPLYVSALTYAARCFPDDVPHKIELQLYSIVDGKELKTACFDVTMGKACEILTNLFKLAFDENFAKTIPIAVLKGEANVADWKTYQNSVKTAWEYFEAGKLFKQEEICGFTKATFLNDWQKETAKLSELVKFEVQKTNKKEIENEK